MTTPDDDGASRSVVAIEGLEYGSVRSLDSGIIAVLQSGYQRSPTLRQLVEDISRTDGIIYIHPGGCRFQRLRGCLLHSIHDSGQNRYLWIRVEASADVDEVTATIAHELQHALEILQQSWIHSRWDVLQFYRSAATRASWSVADTTFASYETAAAVGAGMAVQAELSATAKDAGAVRHDD